MSTGSRLRNSALDSAWTLAWKRPGDPMAHFLLPWKARGAVLSNLFSHIWRGKKAICDWKPKGTQKYRVDLMTENKSPPCVLVQDHRVC